MLGTSCSHHLPKEFMIFFKFYFWKKIEKKFLFLEKNLLLEKIFSIFEKYIFLII